MEEIAKQLIELSTNYGIVGFVILLGAVMMAFAMWLLSRRKSADQQLIELMANIFRDELAPIKKCIEELKAGMPDEARDRLHDLEGCVSDICNHLHQKKGEWPYGNLEDWKKARKGGSPN